MFFTSYISKCHELLTNDQFVGLFWKRIIQLSFLDSSRFRFEIPGVLSWRTPGVSPGQRLTREFTGVVILPVLTQSTTHPRKVHIKKIKWTFTLNGSSTETKLLFAWNKKSIHKLVKDIDYYGTRHGPRSIYWYLFCVY